jgi:hypothetical protein
MKNAALFFNDRPDEEIAHECLEKCLAEFPDEAKLLREYFNSGDEHRRSEQDKMPASVEIQKAEALLYAGKKIRKCVEKCRAERNS